MIHVSRIDLTLMESSDQKYLPLELPATPRFGKVCLDPLNTLWIRLVDVASLLLSWTFPGGYLQITWIVRGSAIVVVRTTEKDCVGQSKAVRPRPAVAYHEASKVSN